MKKIASYSLMAVLCAILAASCKKNDNRRTTENDIFPFYDLAWHDEFEGNNLDTSKWDYRQNGQQRFNGHVSSKAISLNGRGQLIMKVLKEADRYYISQLSTQKTYSPVYGYFECRAKMITQVGPRAAFWMQSHTINETGNNPAKNGAEIDIFEFVKQNPNHIYHTVHWDGYGDYAKGEGNQARVKNIDDGYHTFGLEWNEKEYVFYIDGLETWRTGQGLSKTAQYIILSTELDGFGGNPDYGVFPDSTCFDYVRVYKKRE